MDMNKVPVFDMMRNRMAFLNERQTVLAQNVANADTPGYVPKDMKQSIFSNMVSSSLSSQNTGKMVATHPNHIQAQPMNSMRFATEVEADVSEITPDGNQVVLEDQMLKMNETILEYQATASAYKKMASFLRTAIGNQN